MPLYTESELPEDAQRVYKAYRANQTQAAFYQGLADRDRADFEKRMAKASIDQGYIIPGKTMLQFYYGFKELVINVVPFTMKQPKKLRLKPTVPKMSW